MEALIGGHAPFTLGDDALGKLGEVVREAGRGFHIHVAEDGFDPSYSHLFHGKDALKRLDGFGLVNDKSIIAHGLYLTQEDREVLNSRDAFLAHNCRSNMNNHVGYNGELPHVKNVALGTDGIGSDMLLEVKFAYFRHRDSGGSLAPERSRGSFKMETRYSTGRSVTISDGWRKGTRRTSRSWTMIHRLPWCGRTWPATPCSGWEAGTFTR